MNQEHVLSNETKMAVQSAVQWRRVSNIFSIFLLHSFGVGMTQILWKKVFQKIQDGGWNEKSAWILNMSKHFLAKLKKKKRLFLDFNKAEKIPCPKTFEVIFFQILHGKAFLKCPYTCILIQR
jgi:hypothetical protein